MSARLLDRVGSVDSAGWLDAASQSGTENNGAGALAFVVVGALFVAGWFLYRSLRRQLGRIDFEEKPKEPDVTDEPRSDGSL